MGGWHHRLNRHEFEQTLGDSEGQGCLVCCNSWGHKESGTTEWLNGTELWDPIGSDPVGQKMSWGFPH